MQHGACHLLLNWRLCGGPVEDLGCQTPNTKAWGHQAPNTMAWGCQTPNNGLSILTEGPL